MCPIRDFHGCWLLGELEECGLLLFSKMQLMGFFKMTKWLVALQIFVLVFPEMKNQFPRLFFPRQNYI